ncbi:MAG: glutathionylspermidine synthase family protein [Deltaproteobacteria bacterium]|nr:glutathionylspermidine synthase family protein [Deltaproteobacteria bacterium]
MSHPSTVDPPTGAYDAFAARLVESGIITDPWVDGLPRFREAPLILDGPTGAALARIGREVAALYEEAVSLCHDSPELLDEFFQLSPAQKAMFLAGGPAWHGIARADVFRVTDGWAVAELNCDTPTGEPEAVVLGELAQRANPDLVDPNVDLERHFTAMVEQVTRTLTGAPPATVGLVYPTEFSEDLSLVRLYKRWFDRAGWKTVLGSPYNLARDPQSGRATLFGQPVDVVVRHYKTDWWGERGSAWLDDEILDAEPLAGPLEALLSAALDGKTAIVNPFGAVLPQNKRTMAFFWEHIHRFGVHAQEVIRELIPVTSRLEALHPEMLFAQRVDWVLKSDYGAEGDEVVLGRLTSEEEWRRAIALARPGRWVAQRYFDAERDRSGAVTNLGVFVVAGESAGLYARVHEGATDVYAASTPVLLAVS